MLKDRLKTSAVLISIAVLLMWLDAKVSKPGAEGLYLLPLLLFFALGTAFDFASLLKNSGRPIKRRSAVMATGIVTLSSAVPLMWPLVDQIYPPDCPVGRLGWIVVGAITAVFWILLGEMRTYGTDDSKESGTIERTSAAVLVSIYVGMPMALLVALRSLHSGNWGLVALITMIAVTKSADAGAYFTGKSIGKHKLIPRLSPGKTWEGAIGGVVASTLVAFACLTWLFPEPTGQAVGSGPAIASGLSNPMWGALLLGPLLALSGMVGDLAESLVKRDCGAKDSGTWLPGLGGVWDVTDSLIAAVLPAYLCFAAGVGG